MNNLRAAAAALTVAMAAACFPSLSSAAASDRPVEEAPAALTAEQIVDRSVEVRGGLATWQKTETIIWAGRLESERSPVPSIAFRLEEKRPGKSRFEINEPSQRSVRVFNGTSGWKMKFGQDGKPDVKPFTVQEIKFARAAPGLEGPLIDFRAKGSAVALEGTETLEGRKTYRIAVTLATGEHQTVWVDAESFLELRYDRATHSTAGSKSTISLYFRDYKEVEGLAVPSVIEISGAGGGRPDRMVIERVALNPVIDDHDFDGLPAPRGRVAAEPEAGPR